MEAVMMDFSLLASDLLITLARVSGWTLLSWLLALAVGYSCFKLRWFHSLSMPVVNFFRHISPFCWLPFIIAFAGIGELAVGTTLVLALSFHGVIVCLELLRGIPGSTIEQAHLDGAAGFTLLRHIELPLALAGITDLFRILWGVGWSAVVAAEMLGVNSGMGYRLLDFRYLLRYREMLIYIAAIGLLGVFVDVLLRALRRKVVAITMS